MKKTLKSRSEGELKDLEGVQEGFQGSGNVLLLYMCGGGPNCLT